MDTTRQTDLAINPLAESGLQNDQSIPLSPTTLMKQISLRRVHNASSFNSAIKNRSPQEIARLCQKPWAVVRLKKRWLYSVSAFSTVVRELTQAQCTPLYDLVAGELAQWVHTIADFEMLFNCPLSKVQRSLLLAAIEPRISDLIGREQPYARSISLGRVLRVVEPAQGESLCRRILKEQPSILSTRSDLEKIVGNSGFTSIWVERPLIRLQLLKHFFQHARQPFETPSFKKIIFLMILVGVFCLFMLGLTLAGTVMASVLSGVGSYFFTKITMRLRLANIQYQIGYLEQKQYAFRPEDLHFSWGQQSAEDSVAGLRAYLTSFGIRAPEALQHFQDGYVQGILEQGFRRYTQYTQF